MKVRLAHKRSTSMIDARILDMGFQDISWEGDETGTVHKCIGGRDVYVYAPDESREEYNAYVVKTNDGISNFCETFLIEWSKDPEEVVGLLTKLHLHALATTFIESHRR